MATVVKRKPEDGHFFFSGWRVCGIMSVVTYHTGYSTGLSPKTPSIFVAFAVAFVHLLFVYLI